MDGLDEPISAREVVDLLGPIGGAIGALGQASVHAHQGRHEEVLDANREVLKYLEDLVERIKKLEARRAG
jgi:hypothetical protein